jgi:signal transduction histidine kinase
MRKEIHLMDLAVADDRMVDEVALHHADVGEFLWKNRIERAATFNERSRLARELHDGVLQSLTGAALQLEAMVPLVDNDPQAARERLREIQDLIVEEQLQLRTWITSMQRDRFLSSTSHAHLPEALQTLCRRVSRWGPRVEFVLPDAAAVPGALGDQVYRLVKESLSNVTRHAHAQVARVELQVLKDSVRIVVEDDGCGFPFHGRYDLATLNARRLGPVSLKERIASLDGTLLLTSTLSGSRLEMRLPLPRQSTSRSIWSARRA